MKKLMKIMPVVLVVCIVLVTIYAVPSGNLSTTINGGKPANGIITTTQNIWKTVVTIVQILAVGAVVFAGVRYMFASADQKADIKKSMGILVIGAVLVFGATTVLQLIANTTNAVIQNQ